MDLNAMVQVLRGVSPEVMESLDAETLRALAGVSPDTLRALKDVSPEVVEALNPEVLKALPLVSPDQLQALRHVPAEVVENLSPEFLSALPAVSPAALEALRHVPVEVVENLSPEILTALAGVRPEVLHALKDVPAEVVEALRPEILEALAHLPVGSPSASDARRDANAEAIPELQDLEHVIERLDAALQATPAGGLMVIGYFGVLDSEGRRYPWQSIRIDSGGGGVSKLLATPEWKLAQVLSVFSSEVRLAILRCLLQGPRSAGELVAELRLGTTGQAYHHLRELEAAGYLEQREGRYHFVNRFKRIYLMALALAADAGAGPDA